MAPRRRLLALAVGLVPALGGVPAFAGDPIVDYERNKQITMAFMALDKGVKDHDENAATGAIDKLASFYRSSDDATLRAKFQKAFVDALRQTSLPDLRPHALEVLVATRDGDAAWNALKAAYPKDDALAPTPLDIAIVDALGTLHPDGAIDTLLATFKHAKSNDLAVAAVRSLASFASSKQRERIFAEVIRGAKAGKPPADAKPAPDPKVVARWDSVKGPIGDTLDALTSQHGGDVDGWIKKFDDAKGDTKAFFAR